jgi:glycosyltransferase involved in cell wall biosynthesis
VERADHPFVQAVGESDVEVVPLLIAAREYWLERRLVGNLLRRVKPDVLHTHGYRSDILDIGVGRYYRVGTVTTLHGFTGGDWKVRLYERMQLRAIRKADAVVAVSSGVRDRVLHSGIRHDMVHLIRNAYEPATPFLARDEARSILGIGGDGFRIAWIGRLSSEKGADVMMEALGQLSDLPVALSYIGDGPDRAQLAARAEALGVADRTVFHGVIPNAARLLTAFDAFVLSSRTEGTPMVILEAMAAGTPIIATMVGGVPDMLSDREAVLVPPEDPRALAAAIQEVAANPHIAAARGTQARVRLQAEFGIQPWLSRYESLYHAIRR